MTFYAAYILKASQYDCRDNARKQMLKKKLPAQILVLKWELGLNTRLKEEMVVRGLATEKTFQDHAPKIVSKTAY